MKDQNYKGYHSFWAQLYICLNNMLLAMK